MRLVLQRASSVTVSVDGSPVSSVGPGLLALLAVEKEDSVEDATYLAGKTASLRVFPDANGRLGRSLQDDRLPIMVVSQFTLAGDCRRGRRPDFGRAAAPDDAQELFRFYVDELRRFGLEVAEGAFGEHMEIEAVLDGPVTLLLDSGRSF